jgi:hypothetical protein
MADMATAASGSNGIAFLVSAGLVYEAIAAACSSPQTMEINAKSRAGTLMKWVNLGVGQAALFVVIAAYCDKRHRTAILAGGLLAAGLMYGQYMHAKAAGLASTEPGTESY